MSREFRLVLAAVAAAWATAAAPARAEDLRAASSVTPAAVYLGQPARYTGYVVLPSGGGTLPRWLPADTTEAVTWGALQASRTGGGGRGDTLKIEATLQAFRLGILDIPGFAFVDSARAPGEVRRLPGVRLLVMPVIPVTDSTPQLRPMRAPLRAPWWERVPWAWVVGIALLLGAIVWLVRRRPKRVAAPAPAVVSAPPVDPAETALKRLKALRALRLPEAGAFGEHALELTSILRRYLETTTPRLRPGFTTADLAAHMADEGVSEQDLRVLVNLMRVWDRVKFARAASTADEARTWEASVETFLIGRRRQPSRQEAA
jgi:hypothetical protein